MKLKTLSLACAIFSTFAMSSMGDQGDLKTTPTKPPKKVEEAMPVDRKLEIRLGPRASYLNGTVRNGINGTPFDIADTTGLNSYNPGVQFDVDYQPVKNWHTVFDLAWDHYDQTGATTQTISHDGGVGLPAGAHVREQLDLLGLEMKLGYDVLKTKTFKVMPYLGAKGYYVTGTSSITNDGLGNRGGLTQTRTGNRGFGTYVVGVDGRVYFSRDWYLGGNIGAGAWTTYYDLTGDAYMGYDFSKTWGVRIGYAYDYIDYQNSGNTASAQPLLGAAYVQAVWGF